MLVVKQEAEFITMTPDIDKVIEWACRMCYKSHNLTAEGSAEKMFKNIVLSHKHFSVAEHGSITMHLTTDRAMLAQITRHRHFSFSVESQRYCNYSKDKFDGHVRFIKPEGIDVDDYAYELWEMAMLDAEHYYLKMLQEGLHAEVARSVLPNSTKVELAITGNVRQWRQFFELRANGHAQEDLQYLCFLIFREMVDNGVPKYFFEDIFKGETNV